LKKANFFENKEKMPEPEMTKNRKYRCRRDNQEYDTREDYDSHSKEEHIEM
jgi:hypothetical protein